MQLLGVGTGSTFKVQAIFKSTRVYFPWGLLESPMCKCVAPGSARSVWLPYVLWSPRHKYADWTRNMCFPTMNSTSGWERKQLAPLHSSASERLFPPQRPCPRDLPLHGREAVDPYGQSCPSRTSVIWIWEIRAPAGENATDYPRSSSKSSTLSISRAPKWRFVRIFSLTFPCFWRRELADAHTGLWPFCTIFITDR